MDALDECDERHTEAPEEACVRALGHTRGCTPMQRVVPLGSGSSPEAGHVFPPACCTQANAVWLPAAKTLSWLAHKTALVPGTDHAVMPSKQPAHSHSQEDGHLWTPLHRPPNTLPATAVLQRTAVVH